MKRAFFIVGPESSGTRFIQRSFISAGCDIKFRWRFPEDDGKHNFNLHGDIVFHRSLPHSYMWPDLNYLRLSMENSGFNVIPILVVRDWRCTVISQLKRGMVTNTEAAECNIRKALQIVTTQLTDFILVSYETFCKRLQFRDWLLVERFGLDPSTESIHYGNAQYYEKEEDYIKASSIKDG